MAIRAPRHPYARPEPSAALTGPVLRVIEGRRGVPDVVTLRATELADLIDELTSAGAEMVAMSIRLEIAIRNDRMDLVPEIAARLRRIGETYRDCVDPQGGAA